MSSDPLQQVFVHEHEAMNTTFTIRLLGMDEQSARSLAQLCLERIDQLEGQLSRFLEGSDVSRINALPAGETLYISEPCHECLLLAMQAAAQTHGLFDITLGKRIEHRKEGKDGPMPELEGRLKVHPDVPAVTCEEAGREIDLGGIGKGFALDQLRELLNEWEAGGALITAGASSIASSWEEPRVSALNFKTFASVHPAREFRAVTWFILGAMKRCRRNLVSGFGWQLNRLLWPRYGQRL